MEDLQGRFLPEFLNRIDDIIIFHGLTEDDLSQIVDHLLDRSKRRVLGQGMTLEVTEAAKKLLVAHGHQPEFGARPLRRTIQAELDNRIASILLSGDAEPGDTIVADVVNDTIHCTVRKHDAEDAKAEGAAEEPPAAEARQTPDA
jgi:ATP-dependent Clp protease ATP-binding subunit ClpC